MIEGEIIYSCSSRPRPADHEFPGLLEDGHRSKPHSQRRAIVRVNGRRRVGGAAVSEEGTRPRVARTLAVAPHQQQMSSAFHETGTPRVGFLQLREVIGELLVD